RELAPQEVAEEVVVAIPAAVMVELDEEEVRPLDLLERSRRTPAAQHPVAERRAHALEDRGAPEEAQDARLEPRQVFGPQVVRDVRVVARHPARRDVLERGERGQPQPRGPALAALQEPEDLVLVQLDARSAKQELRLPAAERQLVRADLEQRACDPEGGD